MNSNNFRMDPNKFNNQNSNNDRYDRVGNNNYNSGINNPRNFN